MDIKCIESNEIMTTMKEKEHNYGNENMHK